MLVKNQTFHTKKSDQFTEKNINELCNVTNAALATNLDGKTKHKPVNFQ